jgi:hypothetical protein
MFGLTKVGSRKLYHLRLQAVDKANNSYFIQKQFRFSKHGGEDGALSAAQAHRDTLLKHPDVMRYRIRKSERPVQHRSASPPLTGKKAFPGLTGITLRLNTRTGKTYWSVKASVGSPATDGPALSESFSMKRLGVRGAVLSAIRFREKFFGRRLYDSDTVQADILKFYEDYRTELEKAGITLDAPASP